MLDTSTGNITIPKEGVAIGPSLERVAFLASALGRNARMAVANEPHCSYDTQVPAGTLMPLPTSLTLYFYEQQLDSVTLVALDGRFGASWDDWSEQKELDRKRYHDEWLANTIGSVNNDFSWGHLSSNYDAKAGFSAIYLQYSWQGKAWNPHTTA